jgi:hypothetical protein
MTRSTSFKTAIIESEVTPSFATSEFSRDRHRDHRHERHHGKSRNEQTAISIGRQTQSMAVRDERWTRRQHRSARSERSNDREHDDSREQLQTAERRKRIADQNVIPSPLTSDVPSNHRARIRA